MFYVMEDGGLLVIYDFGITDKMAGNDTYTTWYREEYLKRFPKPFRKENKWTQADLPTGFTMEKQTEYDMEYEFELGSFVDFMLIQSNVNAQIEGGSISADEAKDRMMESLAPIFEQSKKNLIFHGSSWYIRKN